VISSLGGAGAGSGVTGGVDGGGDGTGVTGAVKVNWLDAQSIRGLVRVSQEYPNTAETEESRVVTKKSIEWTDPSGKVQLNVVELTISVLEEPSNKRNRIGEDNNVVLILLLSTKLVSKKQ